MDSMNILKSREAANILDLDLLSRCCLLLYPQCMQTWTQRKKTRRIIMLMRSWNRASWLPRSKCSVLVRDFCECAHVGIWKSVRTPQSAYFTVPLCPSFGIFGILIVHDIPWSVHAPPPVGRWRQCLSFWELLFSSTSCHEFSWEYQQYLCGNIFVRLLLLNALDKLQIFTCILVVVMLGDSTARNGS